MELLNNKKKNPWQAPPLFHHETVHIQKEKLNEDIQPNHVLIKFQPSEDLIKKSGASYVSIKAELSEQFTPKIKFDIEKEGQKSLRIDDQALWKALDRKEWVISLKRKKFICFKEIIGERKKIKLSTLGKQCDFDKGFTIDKYQFSLSFHVRQPTKEKEMIMTPKEKLIIDKFLEPF